MSVSTRLSERPDHPPAVGNDGYIYVIEFSLGVIKVGLSRSPSSRLRSHEHDVARYGGRITRWWLSPPHRLYQDNETALIRAGRRLGRALGGAEYFADCRFDDVVAVAEALDLSPSTDQTSRRRAKAVRTSRHSEAVTGAWRSGAWQAAPYEGNWARYCRAKLISVQEYRWRADERRGFIIACREAGMSMRAIAQACGASLGTICRDVQEIPTDSLPTRVVSLDGRSRPALRRKP